MINKNENKETDDLEIIMNEAIEEYNIIMERFEEDDIDETTARLIAEEVIKAKAIEYGLVIEIDYPDL